MRYCMDAHIESRKREKNATVVVKLLSQIQHIVVFDSKEGLNL